MLHCSYSEARLDAYVEGELAPAERSRVAAHVAECARCAALLHEFRVIDALLLTPRRLEPAPNFTFKVMAEVRAMPAPHVSHASSWRVLGTYIVFAWATIGAFLLLGGASARAALGSIGGSFAQFGNAFGTLAGISGHLFGNQTTDVGAAMGAVLAADIVVAGAIVGVFAVRRSRRAAAVQVRELC